MREVVVGFVSFHCCDRRCLAVLVEYSGVIIIAKWAMETIYYQG